MNSLPSPKLSRIPRLPLIWIVPVVAVVVAVWLLAGAWHRQGSVITIEFPEAAGIEAGRTVLLHKGVPVGVVDEVRLKPDFSGVTVDVQLHRSAAGLARSGSQFWIVHPEIGFTGVRGLEALVGGVQLRVRPGPGAPARSFHGLTRPPPAENPEQGRAYLLRHDRAGHVLPGAPVFYRDVKVGEVETSQLTADATAVLIRVRVRHAYTALVQTNSEFWLAGGLPVQISLFGGNRPEAASLESLFTGAIAFATPEDPAPVAAEGAEFPLHREPEKTWLQWRPVIPIRPVPESPEQPPPLPMPPLTTPRGTNSAGKD